MSVIHNCDSAILLLLQRSIIDRKSYLRYVRDNHPNKHLGISPDPQFNEVNNAGALFFNSKLCDWNSTLSKIQPTRSASSQKKQSLNRRIIIHISNLPNDIKTREIEDLFYKFGWIYDINLYSKDEKMFADVIFEKLDSAKSAVLHMNGHIFDGYELNVQLSEQSGGKRRSRNGSHSTGKKTKQSKKRKQSRKRR